jgi:NADH-quinone oxidoreductase subunit G
MLEGSDADAALQRIATGNIDTLIVAECDLYRLFPAERLEQALSKVNTVVCLDYLDTPTAHRADIALPAATFAEGDGTVVNNEGRAQRYFQALDPSEHIRESWKWLAALMVARGIDNASQFQRLDGAAQAVFDYLGERHDLANIAPPADFRLHDVKIARSPHRFSGRTAMLAHINVSEPKPPDDIDSPLSFSMEGAHDRQPGSLIPFFWSPGWNSVQSTQHYMKEVGAELRGGDPGLRLFEPNGNTDTTYHADIPAPFEKTADSLLAVPLHRIFGSEELSNESAPVQTRIPQAFAAMNEKTLSDTGCTPDQSATVTFNGQDVTLMVRRDDRVPDGVVGIVAGYTDLPPLALPTQVTVSRSAT